MKWNVNRFCLQFVTSMELALMCCGHFGSEVRYINIREIKKNFIVKGTICINGINGEKFLAYTFVDISFSHHK